MTECVENDGYGHGPVRGVCPACGRDGTIAVMAGGWLTCSWIECPDPALVTRWFVQDKRDPRSYVTPQLLDDLRQMFESHGRHEPVEAE